MLALVSTSRRGSRASAFSRGGSSEKLAETPPSQRAYGVFWNVKGKRICLQTTSKTTNEHFRGFFERAFDLSLEPALPGLAAAAFAKEQGTLEALQEARPLSLAIKNGKKRATASVA